MPLQIASHSISDTSIPKRDAAVALTVRSYEKPRIDGSRFVVCSPLGRCNFTTVEAELRKRHSSCSCASSGEVGKAGKSDNNNVPVSASILSNSQLSIDVHESGMDGILPARSDSRFG